MIKFRIQPKTLKGERFKLWKVLEKCQNYRFFYISWDILNKMMDNLGQDCVTGGFYPSRVKIGTIAPDFPGKMSFFQFGPYFSTCPSLKFGFPTHTKIIFLKSAIIGQLARKVS